MVRDVKDQTAGENLLTHLNYQQRKVRNVEMLHGVSRTRQARVRQRVDGISGERKRSEELKRVSDGGNRGEVVVGQIQLPQRRQVVGKLRSDRWQFVVCNFQDSQVGQREIRHLSQREVVEVKLDQVVLETQELAAVHLQLIVV